MASPAIPPRPAAVTMPSDPFEAWLAQQAIAGHDRMWLQRNRALLLKRWKRDDSALPPPLPVTPKPHDRYSEV